MNQTETQILAARYSKRETEADKLGRLITVRRLRPSEEMRVNSYTADLTGKESFDRPQGGNGINTGPAKIEISHRMPLMVAASVCEISGVHIPFPNNRAELDSIYDRLDKEGIDAAIAATIRLSKEEPSLPEQQDLAKNLSGTPPSA